MPLSFERSSRSIINKTSRRFSRICLNAYLFFIAPLLIVYVSAGMIFSLKRFPCLGRPLFIIVCVVISVNTILTIKNSRADDDPYDLLQYREVINSIATADTLELVLLNQTNVRYTLSLAHAIKSGDIQMQTRRDILGLIGEQLDSLKKYDQVFVVSPRVHKNIAAQNIDDIQECMQHNNFTLSQSENVKDLLAAGSLLVFENNATSAIP